MPRRGRCLPRLYRVAPQRQTQQVQPAVQRLTRPLQRRLGLPLQKRPPSLLRTRAGMQAGGWAWRALSPL